MQLVRRTHLYFGLFLFPWAILYGVTGLLFNHPNFLADAPIYSFNRSDLIDTPAESLPSPLAQATSVLAALNELKQPVSPFCLASGDVRFTTRETFVATVNAQQRAFQVVFDTKTSSGNIRETTLPSAATESAPFATDKSDRSHQHGTGSMRRLKSDHTGLTIHDSIADRLIASIPILLARKGLPVGDVSLTNAPNISFPINAEGQIWTATYHPLTSSVTGVSGIDRKELSFRAFLLRMHLTRGYPGEVNTRWIWAAGVDAIAIAMCFWGVSGLCMWWQIKSTRKAGLLTLVISAVAAILLGIGMHGILSN